jgi:putative ABC transport system permease protein
MQNMMTMIVINVVFACLIAYGVVYNASRIILSERGRDLASLRVLGFTRREVSGILLGELAVIVLAGLASGDSDRSKSGALLTWAMSSELYRFPLIITGRTRLFASWSCWLRRVLGLIVRPARDHLRSGCRVEGAGVRCVGSDLDRRGRVPGLIVWTALKPTLVDVDIASVVRGRCE